MSISEEFNFGEDSDGLWYVAIGNEQIVWDLSQEQAEKACTQLKAATSASDARYQARIKELEDAIRGLFGRELYEGRSKEENRLVKALSTTTTPDTALQKAVLVARIDELNDFVDSLDEFDENLSISYNIELKKLRAQLAALGE